MDLARLFIALAVEAPWPVRLPSARLLIPEERHMTLVFMGSQNRRNTLQDFNNLPKPPDSFGLAGYFDVPLFLPERSPRVVSWHVKCNREDELRNYVSIAHTHMKMALPARWLPHVTLGRRPFDKDEWHKNFAILPVTTSRICLYESVGNLRYKSIAEHDLIPPIERLEHTADIAFMLRGRSIDEIFHHALIALCFDEPKFARFRDRSHKIASIDDIVFTLGRFITELDTEEGSPYKAISYHGNLKEKNGILEWEMIVDV